VPFPARANKGTHHEIFWSRQVIRHDQGPRRNHPGSRRQRPSLRDKRDPVGQEHRSQGRPASQLRCRPEQRPRALRPEPAEDI